MMDYFKSFLSILDAVGDEPTAEDLLVASDEIKAISDHICSTKRFQNWKGEFDSFIKRFTGTPDDQLLSSWAYLLRMTVNAPTSYHLVGVLTMCVPAVNHFAKELELIQESNG